jgi:predicted dienelactone hydrolase
MRTVVVAACVVATVTALTGRVAAATQDTGVRALPAPTGSLAVGRVTVHWTDRSRVEPSDGGPRELMIDVWYPAAPTTPSLATYLNTAAFNQPRSDERLKGYLRSAYDAIRAGLVQTHAIDNAPFARSVNRASVLIFSHGGGEIRETYTAQLEDLASHGYVVAAITHTYDAALAVFPDGRHIVLDVRRWPLATTSSIEGLPPSQEASRDRLRWWADDIRFVVNELTRSNGASSSSLPFSGRLDLARIGAFGHSAGGLAAAHACQLDNRIKACLNQDGLSARAPYYLDATGWGMDQAFMLIVRAGPTGPPPEQDLIALKLTLSQALDLAAKMDARHEAALRRTGNGSYRVILRPEGTSHADFGDLPLLQVTNSAEAQSRSPVVATVRNYTRAFFDKQLRGAKTPLLDGKVADPLVLTVDAFPPARRPQ